VGGVVRGAGRGALVGVIAGAIAGDAGKGAAIGAASGGTDRRHETTGSGDASKPGATAVGKSTGGQLQT